MAAEFDAKAEDAAQSRRYDDLSTQAR